MADSEASPTPEPTPEASPTPEPPTKEVMQAAMKAFRKRLSLMQLDEESSLGYGPTSSGQKSRVAAIRPPDQFPRAVWKELAREGKLRAEGKGLYSINEF